jgi:hypothetical protein
MPDIFVNYRHDDGYAAGWLKDRLESEFDVFIDTGLRAGDDLEGHILPELDEARIVLAVIGRVWIDAANLQRLRQADDWIRRELVRAFSRNDAKVIAVLADVQMPKAEQLPVDLQPLLKVKAAEVRYNSWQQDVEDLIKTLAGILEKPTRPSGARGGMPPDLPYLCNRGEQEDDLASLVSKAQDSHSLVCILHGHKWEAHSGFVSRLRQRRVLEDVFAATGASVDIYPLDWNRSQAKAGNHGVVLRSAIKAGAMNRRIASDEQMYTFLRNPGRPAVLMLQVTAQDLQDCGSDLLPALERAWQALMTALGATPTHFLALWLNVTYETTPGSLGAGLATSPLTQLNPVQQGDILSWMTLHEVEPFASGHETALTEIASDQRLWMAPGKIHMQRFVDAVRALFPG